MAIKCDNPIFSAIEGGQSTHNDRTQQHARTGQSKHDVTYLVGQ